MSLVALILVISSTIQFDSLVNAGLSQAEKDACLSSINTLRRLHEATPDLVWSEVVAEAAQKLTDKLMDEYRCDKDTPCRSWSQYVGPTFRDDPCYGRNIYFHESHHRPTCGEAISVWYEGISDYNYKRPYITSYNDRFTQLVWKKSVKVGFGITTGQKFDILGTNVTFLVALFSPKGNRYKRGQEKREEVYAENVRPLKGDGAETLIEENDSSPSRNVTIIPKKERDACLSSVNAFRRLHEATPDLVWSDELATIAQERAEYLAAINTNSKWVLEPEDANTFCLGENIYQELSIANESQTCVQAASQWYLEGIKSYNFTTHQPLNNFFWRNSTRWFTQLVSNDSVRVGFGNTTYYNKLGYKLIFIVAKFSPIGNQFKGDMVKGVNPRRNNISGATTRADFLYIFCFILFLI